MTTSAAALALAGWCACFAIVADAAGDDHIMAERASTAQPANLTHTSVEIGGDRQIISVFGIPGDGTNGPAGSTQPGGASFDPSSSRIDGDRQLNVPPNGNYTVAPSNSGHDAPALAEPADGSLIVAYGAESTYAGYRPPAAWECMPRVYCEPFKRVPRTADVVEALARAPERLLPSAGLSEMSTATLDGATIMAGQQQAASEHGDAGAQGYVSYRGQGRFDTAGGLYDSDAGTPPNADGLYTITRTPGDGAYVEFSIAQAQGSGSIALSIGDLSCSLERLPATGAQAAVDAFVQYANSSCTAFDRRFRAVSIAYTPFERRFGTAAVGVELREGDVSTLPGIAAVRVECGGGISCASPSGPNTAFDVRASGLHRHFLWGGVMRLGDALYDILDVQQVTGSWFGPEHNSYALALACFRTNGPHGAQWVWTDCGGGHAFLLSPGIAPQQRLNAGSPYLIGAPQHGYASNMTPFVYDWSMDAQPPVSRMRYPVISAESATLTPSGSLIVAYGCQDSGGNDAICYVELDRGGRTVRAAFVEDPAEGGSLASIALATDARGRIVLGALVGAGQRWGCIESGGCAITYAYDAASGRWSREQTHVLGGPNDAGFAGTVTAENGDFLVTYHEAESAGRARVVTIASRLP